MKGKANLMLKEAEDLGYENKFDYVFSTEAFHHFYDQKKSMRNFYRSLKKRGELIIVDVDLGIFNRAFHMLEPGNSGMNSEEDFYDLFEKTGFVNIEQKGLSLFAVMASGKKPYGSEGKIEP